MKKLTLDLETIAVETFPTGEQQAPEMASGTRWCTIIDTCTNCFAASCIC
ncbi:MAG TPA: hypothetical protein VF771_00535 [Longimicrobiaceae bacterium]